MNLALLKVFNLKLNDTVKNTAWRRLNCLEDIIVRLHVSESLPTLMIVIYDPLTAIR